MTPRRRRVNPPASERRLRQWLEDVVQDVRYALRQWRMAPGFTALLVLTLAIGIGANAAMVGAIDRLLFRAPAHVRDPDRLVRLLLVAPNPLGGEDVSPRSNYATYEDFAREVPSFEAIGAYSPTLISFGEGSDAVEARASLVSASFFSVFGVTPAMGRLFLSSDNFTTQGTPTAVLGHGFWQRQFGGDIGVLGSAVRVGSLTYTVIGVAPAGFQGVDAQATDVWLPVTVAAEKDLGIPLSLHDRGSAWLSMVARLRPHASRAQAEQQATSVWREHNEPPGSRGVSRRIVAASVIPGRGPDRSREVDVALWLTGVSALVLLIACANVANLLLARTFARRGEIAVRLAMGATQERLARQMFAESMLLAVIGGATGLYVATLGGRLTQRLILANSDTGNVFSYRVLLITATIALGTGVLISLAPLTRTTSLDLIRWLREAEGATRAQSSRVRMSLLGTQATLCMMLLIVAGLFARSLRQVQGLDLGMDIDRTLLARIDLGSATLSRSEVQSAYEAMLNRVQSLEGVAHAALAARDPFTAARAVPAHTPAQSEESLWHREGILRVPMEVLVDSGFFRALRTTSLRGRDFDGDDRRGAPRVAVVNETLAELLWPGKEPLGECMLLAFDGGECITVIGVVRGFLRRTILDRDELIVYLPLAQSERYVRPGSIVIASTGDPATVASHVRQAIQSVRPDLPAVSVVPMRDLLGPQFRPWEMAAGLFGMFAGAALLIAMVGIYGVVAFTAAQRSREVAIRIALGARPRHVLILVAGGGLALVGLGLAIGTSAALVLRGWIGPLLFQTSPNDPAVIASVGGLLLAVAGIASVIPTVRVIRRSPVTALRME